MATTITLCDPRRDSDEVVAERIAFAHELHEEVLPGDPPASLASVRASTDAIPARYRMWSFRGRDEAGALVGIASTAIDPEHDDDPDILWVNLSVVPAARRAGLGGRLLRELVGVAREEGRTRLQASYFRSHEGGSGFAAAFGFEAKLDEHVNVLPLAEVDRPMLERWVDEGPGRAEGYELVAFDHRVPDDLLEAWCDLMLVMNTAPRDDLEVNDFTLTPSQWREGEERRGAAGVETWFLVARHAVTGALAGWHDVSWHPDNPTVVHVGGTAVRPEHRGHALGKWLKAVMTLRVLDERPQATQIRTGNADSNEAMLGINRVMGYRPLLAATTAEARLDEVEKRLADRGLL